ncbi:L,D-transpeptidase [Calidifontibacillus oryziterrae]|uniref:L,D-transpeptidase n=1 Tax=Calidifontibacillus oryziterrae TaxID=1191699 RepID=UPI000301BC39|nr:L,D-transpeptidase [Calidifontibacillus oryziterrae]
MVRKRAFFILIICLCLVLLFPSLTKTAAAENNSMIIINKATNKLAFFDEGQVVKVFDVATGRKMTYTPEGTFTVLKKIKNRPYYKKNIPGGSPNNPLGDRWLGLSVPGTWGNVYGIHGNNNESSIGKYISDGCVRMHNDDVRWLFDQISTGIQVVIVNEKKDFEDLAKENGYELKLPEIIKGNKNVTIFLDKELFTKPSRYSNSFGAMISSPQVVKVFEETDTGFYHIRTWLGDAWITKEATVVGELNQVEKKLVLTKQTTLYTRPNGAYSGEVSPQTVKAFEQVGSWYHIFTWFGDAWINVKN